MQIFLDPWNPEFVPSIQAESPEEGAAPQAQLDIESAEWKPIRPAFIQSDFIFVDGVRRVEARVILQDEKILYGIFGSAAAGAMMMTSNRLNTVGESLIKTAIERYFITGGTALPFEHPLRIRPNFEFAPVSVPDESAQAPAQKLQQLMRDAEGKVIDSISKERENCVIVADGPLHFPWARQSSAVGYIKSFHEWYLPQSHVPGLGTLEVGERTPLFLIYGQGAQFPDRFAWFVRLSKPAECDSPLSGLARLEAACDLGLDKAKKLADRTVALCGFVAKKYRDPRSPQNLLPIGALEKSLKHLLGESLILQRWIQSWIQKKAAEPAQFTKN